MHLSGLSPSSQMQLSAKETELSWLSPSWLPKPFSPVRVAHSRCVHRSLEISVENDDHFSRRAVPMLRANSHCTAACYVHRICCNLLVRVSASEGVEQNGLGLVIFQSSVLCLLETTAVCKESVLSTEIQKYLLIKIATPSTARQFQDTCPVCVLSHLARIFGEQMNSLSASADT